jgi:DNA processing protein
MLPNNEDELLARLALTFIDGIGPKMARMLLAHFGTASAVMQAPARELKGIGGMGEVRAKACRNPEVAARAAKELAFIQKHGISILFLTDEAYPSRLKSCDDAPMLLYHKGSTAPQADKVVAVIGTRKNTEYGQRATEDLIDGLAGQEGLVVVSGLAYGIDAIAHKRCLKAGIPTIGVVGHGLDRIYPAAHKSLAKEMIAAGGILSEFPSGTNPDRSNFPLRNRVVAGLSDVSVVVESDEKGGAMITAYMAASYNREVAAFPGRVYDSRSGGPNKLICMNIASLITGAQDLLEVMNWTASARSKGVQQQLFLSLTDEEQHIVSLLRDKDAVHADELMLKTGRSSGQIAATLLQLEMAGLVKTLPGKMYRVN